MNNPNMLPYAVRELLSGSNPAIVATYCSRDYDEGVKIVKKATALIQEAVGRGEIGWLPVPDADNEVLLVESSDSLEHFILSRYGLPEYRDRAAQVYHQVYKPGIAEVEMLFNADDTRAAYEKMREVSRKVRRLLA